jgi:Tetratricopeptide repeat
MTTPREPGSNRGRKRGRRTESLGNRLAQGVDQSPETELRQAEEVLRWSIRKHGPDSTFSIRAMNDVADQLARQDRGSEEAIVLDQMVTALRNTLGDEHDSTLSAELKLAICLLTLERAEDAEPLLAHVVAGRTRAAGGGGDAATLAAMAWSATAARQLGRLGEARTIQEQVLAGLEFNGAGESLQGQSAGLNLAATLADLDVVDEAVRLVGHVLEIRTRTLAPDDPRTLDTLGTLVTLLLRSSDVAAALEPARALVERRTRVYGADAAETAQAREFLAAIQLEGTTE